jgi:uncharacterized protein (DUF952 family)
MSRIYKLLGVADWGRAQDEGAFAGAGVDVADGYIHFSTAVQAQETARLHFAGRDDLVLLEVEADELGADLKWEPSRGGQLFPHLYGVLPIERVKTARTLVLGDDGVPILGDLAP